MKFPKMKFNFPTEFMMKFHLFYEETLYLKQFGGEIARL